VTAFTSEAELAAAVVAYLEHDAWDVYQEVRPFRDGGIADIVAVRGHLLWVIETKLSLSLDLLAQAEWWTSWAHLVSIAIPGREQRPRSKTYHYARMCARRDGVGILDVYHRDYGPRIIEGFTQPPLHRKALTSCLRRCLDEGHKTHAPAGTKAGGIWTPFRDTCERLMRHVAENEGTTLKAAIDAIDHHYSNNQSARSSLRRWLDEGKVPGVEMRRDGRLLRLYIAGVLV
jgi:hypothetical protein